MGKANNHRADAANAVTDKLRNVKARREQARAAVVDHFQ